MLSGQDIRDITGEGLHAFLLGFANRLFSGHLYYTMERSQLVRLKWELHILKPPNGSRTKADHQKAAQASLAEHWSAISEWLLWPETELKVSFQYGTITRVRIGDIENRNRGQDEDV
jgi:hypothetical protein